MRDGGWRQHAAGNELLTIATRPQTLSCESA